MRNLAAALAILLAACSNNTSTDTASSTTEPTPAPAAAAQNAPAPAMPEPQGAGMDTFSMPTNLQTTPSGLQYSIDRPGTGAQPQTGQTVVVHYTGWLTNGTKFDSSRDRNQPFEFAIGRGDGHPRMG